MEQITFIVGDLIFNIVDYQVVGNKLRGMSDNKIFIDDDVFFKNHSDNLLKINQFTIKKGNVFIKPSDYMFDTSIRVGAVIIFNNRVLLNHRVKKGNEYYVFPGGHVKQGESFINAVIREIKEETNLNINESMINIMDDLSRDGFGREIYFIIKPLSIDSINISNPEAVNEVSDLIWFTFQDAKSIENLFPRGIIDKAINLIN